MLSVKVTDILQASPSLLVSDTIPVIKTEYWVRCSFTKTRLFVIPANSNTFSDWRRTCHVVGQNSPTL